MPSGSQRLEKWGGVRPPDATARSPSRSTRLVSRIPVPVGLRTPVSVMDWTAISLADRGTHGLVTRADRGRPLPELGDQARLEDVRAELAEIEALDRRVDDLMAALRARLPAGEFRLVWALRDATECLVTAELILRDRRLARYLAREFPARSAGLEAIRRGLLGDALLPDEAG